MRVGGASGGGCGFVRGVRGWRRDVPLAQGETDGAKTLYVDLRDQCGMERRYTASLTYDTTPPVSTGVEVVADEGLDGKRYVRSADGQVTVRLSGEDALSGLDGTG